MKTKPRKIEPTPAPITPVPTTRAEAEALLARIGEGQRSVQDTLTRMNAEMAIIKQVYEDEARPQREQIEADFAALAAWSEGARGELLKGDAKSVKLTSGELGWRTTPPRVTLSKIGVVIASLKALNLHRFLRQTEEVNKDAMLAEPEAVRGVKGVSITQTEMFWAKPFGTEIEQTQLVRAAEGK